MRILALVVMLTACGGGEVEITDAGADAPSDSPAPNDGPWTKDGGGGDGGAFACGTASCNSAQICVHPCCGGAPPACVEKNDAGVCPEGTSATGNCASGNKCTPDPCVPPPPYCDKPGSCQSIQQGHDCYLACG